MGRGRVGRVTTLVRALHESRVSILHYSSILTIRGAATPARRRAFLNISTSRRCFDEQAENSVSVCARRSEEEKRRGEREKFVFVLLEFGLLQRVPNPANQRTPGHCGRLGLGGLVRGFPCRVTLWESGRGGKKWR